METTKGRLRVRFQDTGILNKTQKKNGLKRSWIPFTPQFHTISDITSYLLHSFDLYNSCPNGVILSMDGFVLPPFESTSLLKHKDLICVKRKGSGKCDVKKAIEGVRPFIEDQVVEKQLLPSGISLLANEEFDKETKGYQIESLEDEDKVEEPVQSAAGKDVASKKRKASNDIESLKKKRQRQAVPGKGIQKKDVDSCEHVKTPQKKRKLVNGPKHEGTVKCTKNAEPIPNELEEKREKTVHTPGVSNGAKKGCRSSYRNKLKRMFKRRAKANEAEDEKEAPMNNLSKDLGFEKDSGTNIEQPVEEDSDADDDLIPIEIRPGHIRFGRSSKANDFVENQEENGLDVQSTQKSPWEDPTQKNDWDVNKNKVAKESFCWNGITSKKKGQKWGKENQPTSWKESRNYNSHPSSSGAIRNQQTPSWKGPRDNNSHSLSTWASRKQLNDAFVDFEKLVPLVDLPKVGDVIAYRLLELSSSWCPQLSSFRVGKIKSFDQESNIIIVVPEPEYPLYLEKKTDGDQDGGDDSGKPPQPSVYNEDGSLEIDFPSLVDVRIVKRGDPSQSKATEVPAANGTSTLPGMSKKSKEAEDASKTAASYAGKQQSHTPAAPANGKKDVWEEISDALIAKKAQLMQQDTWNKKQPLSKRSWSNRTLKSSALGPTMARLRAQNGAQAQNGAGAQNGARAQNGA